MSKNKKNLILIEEDEKGFTIKAKGSSNMSASEVKSALFSAYWNLTEQEIIEEMKKE